MGWITTVRDGLFETIAEDLASLPEQARVLDVGTGKGLLPIRVAQTNQDLQVYGLDISEKAVNAARKNSLDSGLANPPEFYLGDASSLPFEDGCFDLVVSTFSLHHWPEPVKGLNEIYRILKPGGKAGIYDHWKDPSPSAKTRLRKKYGWTLSTLALLHLRLVSSPLTEGDATILLQDPALKFKRKELKHHDIFLVLELGKSP
ncbi:MAG: class I SAM-dependent methyltransferase [Methanotrichaceae archaeon]|nr:class I SAM-dependent methyltransferase [Methanotrichaceae archaeon]